MEIDGMNSVDQRHKTFPLKGDPCRHIRRKRDGKDADHGRYDGHDEAVEKILTDIELCKDGDVSVKHPFFRKSQPAWRLLEGVEKYPQDRIQGNHQHERHQQIPKHFYRNRGTIALFHCLIPPSPMYPSGMHG